MTARELRMFRRDGREFRASRDADGTLLLSEWAAAPGEEWRELSQFALSHGEFERLVSWRSGGSKGLQPTSRLGTPHVAATDGHQSDLGQEIVGRNTEGTRPEADEADGVPSPPSDSEIERLVSWLSAHPTEPAAASLADRLRDLAVTRDSVSDSKRSELKESIAQGKAKRVSPSLKGDGDSLPPPKARGAYKRPPLRDK